MVKGVSWEDLAMDGELDYRLCRCTGTRLWFRGPVPSFDTPFAAMLGGTETFGKYVEAPFPALLSEWTGLPVMNLGIRHAGLSLFSDEPWLLDTASRAKVTVIQILGAQNMSNRLYSVHKRRNDRFLGVSPALRDMYPGVDFAEINFTRHLLGTLAKESPNAFSVVVEELKWAWIQRMRRIIGIIQSDVLLLWVSGRGPEETRNTIGEGSPLFVDRSMLDELSGQVAGIVEVVLPRAATVAGKVFPEGEEVAARALPGPAEHARIAEALSEPVLQLSARRDRPNAARA